MTAVDWCTAVLLVGALLPALVAASVGEPVGRLVGLEMLSATLVVVFLLASQSSGQSYELAVPLVFVPLSFAGTLVFTRLLGRRSSDDA